MPSIYTRQSANKKRTFFLFFIFLIIVIGVGWLLSQYFGNPSILYVAVIFAVVMNILAYWRSDKIVLRMTKAEPADKEKYRELHNIVENLSITAGLPTPKIYLIHESQPNAFATGRNPDHAVVAVTEGLLGKLNRSELEGVLSHELSHIGNRDMLISTAAVVLVGFVSILADIFLRSVFFRGLFGNNRRGGGIMMLVGIIVAVLAPIGALLIQLAISRQREYLADASGALLTRYPEGLANALQKISKDSTPMRKARTSTAHLWISSPFKKGFDSKIGGLFQTHPPVEERIARLKGLEIK